MLRYPVGFPPHLQAPVERDLVKAERALWERLSSIASSVSLSRRRNPQSWNTNREQRGEVARVFVDEVWPGFAHEACNAGREGSWSIQRIRDAVDEYLVELIRHAYELTSLDGFVGGADLGGFRKILLDRIKQSDAWRTHLNERQEVAEMTTPPRREVTAPPSVEVIDAPVSVSGVTPEPPETPKEKAARRQAVLEPLLIKAGLNRNSWAEKAVCDANSVYRYWRGERGLNTETQRKLAKVLGLESTDLPD